MVEFAPQNGQVSEWPKEHAWKVCIPQGIEGSNPSLTAISINCLNNIIEMSSLKYYRNY